MFVVWRRVGGGLLESTLKYDVSYATRLSHLSGICLLLRASLFLALRAADPVFHSHSRPLSQPARAYSCFLRSNSAPLHSLHISLTHSSAWLQHLLISQPNVIHATPLGCNQLTQTRLTLQRAPEEGRQNNFCASELGCWKPRWWRPTNFCPNCFCKRR